MNSYPFALLQKDRSFEPDMAVMVEAPDHSRDVEGSIVLACRRWKIATACLYYWVAVIASACPIYLECLIKGLQVDFILNSHCFLWIFTSVWRDGIICFELERLTRRLEVCHIDRGGTL